MIQVPLAKLRYVFTRKCHLYFFHLRFYEVGISSIVLKDCPKPWLRCCGYV